jgi:hypothetical protein
MEQRMTEISYEGLPWPVRDDITAAHRRQWARLARPGTWLTGEERVAIAAEARNAANCDFCNERKDALSPHTVTGDHDSLGQLPAAMVEQIHRIRTDSGRLTRDWHDSLIADGISQERYVETVGVIADTVAIDTFCRGLGVPLWPLPQAEAGQPTSVRPPAELDIAWVPTLSPDHALGTEFEELYDGRPQAAHIYQAMSLVPEEVKGFFDLVVHQYIPGEAMRDFENEYRAIDHAQIELVAGRVSALNQCVY